MKQVLEEALGRGRIAAVLAEDVEHDAVLIDRSPEECCSPLIRRNTSSRCQVSPGFGRPGRSLSATSWLNLRHQRRMVDPLRGSTVGHDHGPLGQQQLDIRQAQAEDVVKPDHVADDLAGEAVAVRSVRSAAHADSLH